VNTKPATYVSFCSRIRPGSTDQLLRTCTRLANDGVSEVYLMLSTPGGSVSHAIAAYNLLRGLPFRLVTHNVGSVNSMGNVLFLAGDRRLACPDSTFMFHGVGFTVDGGSRFDLRALREKVDSVQTDQRKIAAILAARTGLDTAAIETLFDEAVTHDPATAERFGIVHEIAELVIPQGARVVHVPAGG
jgi:ATP-dependent protease ClpP protease subunit